MLKCVFLQCFEWTCSVRAKWTARLFWPSSSTWPFRPTTTQCSTSRGGKCATRVSLARRRPSPQCLRAVRAAHFKPSATFPGIDPDAQMPLPPTAINNSVSRPDRKHHQHHVNPLATSRPSASPPTRPRPLCTDKVHVSQNISSAGVDDVREAGEGVGGVFSLPLCQLTLAGVYAEVSISGMWWKLLLGRSRGASRSSEAFRRHEREDKKAFWDLQELLRLHSGAPGGALNSFFSSMWVVEIFF